MASEVTELRGNSPEPRSPVTPKSPPQGGSPQPFSATPVFRKRFSANSAGRSGSSDSTNSANVSPEPLGPSTNLFRAMGSGARRRSTEIEPTPKSPSLSFYKAKMRSRSMEHFDTWEDLLSDEETPGVADLPESERTELERMAAELKLEEADLQRDQEVEAYSRRRRKSTGLLGKLKKMINGSSAAQPSGVDRLPRNNVRRDSLQVDKPLGEGSCALVCRAEWHGQPVAAKILKNSEQYKRRGSTVEEAKETLFKEIEMAAVLKHPNLVAVVGTCEKGFKGPILVQELLSCSLKKWYDDRVRVDDDGKVQTQWIPSEMLATRWSLQLAQAVEFLHGLGPAVIHRDIKPDNVMLDSQMNAKLGDFGLARRMPKSTMRNLLSSAKKATYRMSGATGSLRYMAPEILMVDDANMCNYNEMVDVYSLAMCMYFMCTGKIPFHFIRAPDAAGRAVMGMRPTLDTVVGPFPSLVNVIAQAWAQDPEQRPSAADLVTVLSDIKHTIHEQKATSFLAKLTKDSPGAPSRSGSYESGTEHSRTRSMSISFSGAEGSKANWSSNFSVSVGAKMWPFGGSKPSSPVSSPRRHNSSGGGSAPSSSFISRISRSISPTRKRSVSPRRPVNLESKESPSRSQSPNRPESPNGGSFSPMAALRRGGRWRKGSTVEKMSSEVDLTDPNPPVERITS